MTRLLRSDLHVAHGYTMADLYDIATYAIHTDFVRSNIDWADRVAAAWSAIALELIERDTPPRRYDLVNVGQAASHDLIQGTMRHHGKDNRPHRLGESRVSFERYWTQLPGTPLADRVVDGVSLSQIWPRLRPIQQDAILALAVHGDYTAAAKSLGLSYDVFCDRIRRGRKLFLWYWHEGETPSKPWGSDRRKGRDTSRRTAVRVLANRKWRRGRQFSEVPLDGPA